MRSLWRTLDRALARDIALVCVACAFVGVSFGAITVSSGLPVWLPTLMSVAVFAGASQFMFVAIIASGGGLVAAVVTGLLVNTRLLPLGFAVGDVISGNWRQRLFGSHITTDEVAAFTMAQRDPGTRRAAFWGCGLGLFASWNLGVLLGAFGGTVIKDTNVFGLDAAFPAVLLALVLPSLKDGPTRRAAAVGVVIALATSPFLTAGAPVLLALVGVLASLGGDRFAAKKVAT
ncbi:AzlC family ABC transporter permease [Kibdelosporangium phytohabitans]|uniref:Branched-chain amino acid permease n=1 Tax=Kibdelosporangium phytohabitans TaxID=860235 RepID=A0A0N7F4G1_9PSEU|nr:AzlC family ABC transporter permease [Kibdelosporangium phytohabitans]ALG11335.1 branched-chain amino acid permease [Kibdelosporangium phytohabitans]MBE1462646.1 4-azaleucine resistance transporter AzlC [Kibdelosporangium phytohabitans]